MRTACLTLILFASLVLGAPILAAYLHASIWWLLPVAMLMALALGIGPQLIRVGVAPSIVITWLIALPCAVAFPILCAVYWLAERFLS